jgi:very-short-patch-repair endonuclease
MTSARPAAGAAGRIDACVAALARHQLARQHGAVVLSVLRDDDARHAWRHYLAGAHRAGVLTTATEVDAVLAAWIGAADAAAVSDAARAAAAQAAAVPSGSLAAHFAFRGERQREEWIADWALTPALRLAAWLCQGAADGERRDPAEAPLGRADIAAALAAWLGAEAPALSITGDADVATGARCAAALAHALPTVPVALSAPGPAIAAYLRDSAESSSKALVRQGLVGRDEDDGDGDGDGGEIDDAPVLGRNPFGREPTARRAGSAMDPDEPGRSAAERVLLAALEADPRTRGHFALGVRIDADFGGQRAEIDLLAAGAGVAIEVDGYFHFRDADAYRRDRRKDVVLQRHGLLVMRFLADDVVGRTAEVVAAIADALARRSPTV